MKLFALALAATALSVSAQTTSRFPDVPQSLVRYFALTPEQAGNIRAMNSALSDAFDEGFGRIEELDEQINVELEKASPDSHAVGAKVVEIVMIERDLERQFAGSVAKVQAQLTPEQKQKLKVLEDAMALAGTIRQASQWLFLPPPEEAGALFGATTERVNRTERTATLLRSVTRKSQPTR